MANEMESPSQPSSDLEPATPTPPQDLVFPSLPGAEKIYNWWRQDPSSPATSTSTTSPSTNPPPNSPAPSETFTEPDNMSTPSDDGNSLGGSSYEFIDTDEESRDGNATESVASTDFGRPDEVASLAGTERSGDSGDDDDNRSSVKESYTPMEDSDVTTKARSSTIVASDVHKPVIQTIEFEEPKSRGAHTLSVVHVLKELDEVQTAAALKGKGPPDHPKRVTATIRQSMTREGLSTRDPLRILYVGSHSAKQDIIHKIASSVTAVVDGKLQTRQFPSQLYNVVPVSAFGTEKTPEIELMHSSGFQIKVEDCTGAKHVKYEDSPGKPDLIKLTVDDNLSYHSVPEGRDFTVEPHWELPHVGILYCSDNDEADTRQTMTAARRFLARHGVPSIVISHTQQFDRSQCITLDQHAIHMCLESRDPKVPGGTIIHRRLPIDLASFLNIDARQMNKNLAYITGLRALPEDPKPLTSLTKRGESNKPIFNDIDFQQFIANMGPAAWTLFPLGLVVLTMAALHGIMAYGSSVVLARHNYATSAIPMSTVAPSMNTQVPTIKVATETVTVMWTPSATSEPNSLAVLPFDLSPRIQRPSTPDHKPSVCKAEITGDRVILIRMPSATKLGWLTKEAMSVSLTRDNVKVDPEVSYITDDGIVLMLPMGQAYGVLNVSIITTKKPRINESFEVDFGTGFTKSLHSILDSILSMYDENACSSKGDSQCETMNDMISSFFGTVQAHSQATLAQVMEAKKAATDHTRSTSQRVKNYFNRKPVTDFVKKGRTFTQGALLRFEIELEAYKKLADHVQGVMGDGLLKAQVQSKLLWLKARGKNEEYEAYQARALRAIKQSDLPAGCDLLRDINRVKGELLSQYSQGSWLESADRRMTHAMEKLQLRTLLAESRQRSRCLEPAE